ncbi:hypothetical protein A2662_00695 [Candidatus Giovannonibacteria bacterium RIFCSPHIGHO2_01_FULL_45_33]|uniref:Uncharacterized protein n=1 Tax=Candidatus Giovannonibacteria bacterium RIFCSPLOWO2_01_FULL_45_34 TaxID=1798351 RepID=A0A1F5WYX2_9BACT|nr:MAG: hypothetical protein A2662_00695 [Candidatus Giovannonibacteria bacterium RIFCSPHIGHO2_01_FULL_45_33]OGF68881.1 MAG: hypothetical protein A3C73_02550 [Candidatus Giovannonibacteria bacterium RIFCSPHIGHO2_02_FULL_44_11]OGF80842.1 MAG: hypothetical protein A2930_00510 [Candidatus Giovannonibacteria bacterium RIFCSPLOWO2_01_FULL_45_34]
MFEKFDFWLIEILEPEMQKLQRFTGYDCFWWAKIFVVLFIIFVNSFAVLGTLFGNKFSPILSGSSLLTLLTSPLAFWTIKIVQARTYQNQINGLANEYKLQLRGKRLMLLTIFVTTGFAWGLHELHNIPIYIAALCLLGFSCLGIVYYAISCDPLPPAKSKVRNWLGNLLEKTKEFLSPEPELVPVPAPAPNRRPYR